MDTYIDGNGGFVGQIHFMLVDANDENNWIRVYYRRDVNEIFVQDSVETLMSIGTNDEFRFKVTVTIQADQYMVEVGPYISGWIAQSVFPSEFGLKMKLYIRQAGSYPSHWWIAGFDDVAVNGKKRSKNADYEIDLPRFLNNFPILQKFLLQLLGL